MLSINTFFTCPDNMVNFGLLTAEIYWRVWGTPADFNGVYRLGSVTARHSSSGRQPNCAALNRGRRLCSAGRPSRWALAHISSTLFFGSRRACTSRTILATNTTSNFFSRKEVHFGSQVDIAPNLEGQVSPQKKQKRACTGIFKPNHEKLKLLLFQSGKSDLDKIW